MLTKDLVDYIYDYMSSKLTKGVEQDEDQAIDFNVLCQEVAPLLNMSQSEFNSIMGSIYTDMLQDARFLLIGNNKWTLRHLNTLDFLKKNQSVIYNYENYASIEELYDEDALPEEMVNADNEVYDENPNEVSRDRYNEEMDSDSDENSILEDDSEYDEEI